MMMMMMIRLFLCAFHCMLSVSYATVLHVF